MKMQRLRILSCLLIVSFVGCKNQEPPVPEITPDQKNQTVQIVKEARIAFNEDATTIDPRKARSLNSINIARLLFEGLSQIDSDGNASLASAETLQISDDQKTYTFTLKDATWSNGEQVTARDFEYSWKSSLNPKFGAPNAYQLFVIKNAKAAYDGKVSPDVIGVHALDDKTLEVHLENPTPYFMQLLAFHPFFPVPLSQKDAKESDSLSGNGPFVIKEWKHAFEIVLQKNSTYHNAKAITLEQVRFPILDETTAFNMFEGGELDWIGSPVSLIPPDAIATCKKEHTLKTAPAAGTQIIRINIEKAPFTNEKMRRAFCYAVDRQGICQHIMQGGHCPATSFVPPCMKLAKNNYFQDATAEKAQALFAEARQEELEPKAPLEPIVFSYASNDRNQKIALSLQQNWKTVFGIDVILDPCESKIFYEKISKKTYQLALGSWIADFNDPVNFLSVFQYKNNGTNNTQWESSAYIQCLQEASGEANSYKRAQKLAAAEAILMAELPIIPIYHYVYNYVKNDRLQGVELSPLGYIELKCAKVN